MIFSCEKQTLSEAISIVMKAASNKASMPVLEGILMSTDQDSIMLTANNLEMGIECRIPANIREDGAIVTGDVRVFSEIVRKLPPGEADITVHDNFSTTVQNGKSVYNILGTNPEEFPELPLVLEDSGITVKAAELRKMISQTVYAAAQKNERPVLTGVLFEIEPTAFHMVALDGFRMAIHNHILEENPDDEPYTFIVPAKTLLELSKILPDDETPVLITASTKHVLFTFSNIRVVSRLLSGEFFQYNQIIPKDFKIQLTLNLKDLLTCVERADPIVSTDVYKNPVVMTLSADTLSIDCVTAVGKAHDVIEIPDCQSELRIGFNQRYLHDALSVCDCEEIIMEFNGSRNPCIIRPAEGDDFLFMVLPVRISE